MFLAAKFIAILIIAMGAVFLLSPQATRAMFSFWKKGNRFYIAGFLRLLFGIVLLLAASECKLPGVIIAFGILFLLGGVTIFAIGLNRAKSIVGWWEKKPVSVLRFTAIVPIIIGALLLYAI